MPPSEYACPKCGTDVMVTGFTLWSQVSKSYMRFNKMGPVQIASTVHVAERAECMVCAKPLPWEPTELMRSA